MNKDVIDVIFDRLDKIDTKLDNMQSGVDDLKWKIKIPVYVGGALLTVLNVAAIIIKL